MGGERTQMHGGGADTESGNENASYSLNLGSVIISEKFISTTHLHGPLLFPRMGPTHLQFLAPHMHWKEAAGGASDP